MTVDQCTFFKFLSVECDRSTLLNKEAIDAGKKEMGYFFALHALNMERRIKSILEDFPSLCQKLRDYVFSDLAGEIHCPFQSDCHIDCSSDVEDTDFEDTDDDEPLFLSNLKFIVWQPISFFLYHKN